MLIHDNFIFVHLQKCAGTTIREFLMKIFPDCIRTKREHLGISGIPAQDRNKLIIGTVRNPYAWYVSWYSGRQGSKDTSFKNLFQCDFKEFLGRCFFTETRTLHDVNFTNVRNRNIGPYTYRYDKCYKSNFKKNLCIIKTENLKNELGSILQLSDKQLKLFDAMGIMNSSNHKYYLEYYDEEMISWVRKKDKKIFEKYYLKFHKENNFERTR